MTIQEALLRAEHELKEAGVAEPRSEAASLLALAMHTDDVFVRAYPEHKLSGEAAQSFERLLGERRNRVPFAQLAGSKEFFGRRFDVNAHVLIPRPETEILIEETVRSVEALGLDREDATLLDVGCGPGTIGLTLLAELPRLHGLLLDVSPQALTIARKNARNLSLGSRVEFLHQDLLDPDMTLPNAEILVANLPYLPEARWGEALPEVRVHEPKLALVSGGDGLGHYRTLFRKIGEMGAKPTLVAVEAEPDQMDALEAMAREALPEHESRRTKDLDDDDRVLICHTKPRA